MLSFFSSSVIVNSVIQLFIFYIYILLFTSNFKNFKLAHSTVQLSTPTYLLTYSFGLCTFVKTIALYARKSKFYAKIEQEIVTRPIT